MIKNKEAHLKKIIQEHDLYLVKNITKFISENPMLLTVDDLSRVAEISNNHQESTAAYYTDPVTVATVCKYLPDFGSASLRILEPSVGVGNIIRQVINKYKDDVSHIEVDVFDINSDSLKICEILINKEFGRLNNVKINYIHGDFLTYPIEHRYDLIIGNPPFMKIKGEYLHKLRKVFNNIVANNISAFFLDKSMQISNSIALIMPKYFLHNVDFSLSREKAKSLNINAIIDFGETGFKGVLIETICLFIDTQSKNIEDTYVKSISKKNSIKQKQSEITDAFFPNWLIYTDEKFKKMASEMSLGIFNVFRDRQITKGMLGSTGDTWVIKSKNIPRSGEKIVRIDEDAFIDSNQLSKFAIRKYIERDDVFLSPNMTYYPRVVKKPKNCVVNGSIAILELKEGETILETDLLFFASAEFENFYRIARNHSTRSLNIDSIAIFYFGKWRQYVQ